jgi:hypothetical protein
MDLLGKLYVHVGLGGGKGDGVVGLLLVVGEGVGSDELLVDVDSEGDNHSGLLVIGGEDGGNVKLPVVAGEGCGANSSSLGEGGSVELLVDEGDGGAELLVAAGDGGDVELLVVGVEGVSGDELLGNFCPRLKLLVPLFTS